MVSAAGLVRGSNALAISTPATNATATSVMRNAASTPAVGAPAKKAVTLRNPTVPGTKSSRPGKSTIELGSADPCGDNVVMAFCEGKCPAAKHLPHPAFQAIAVVRFADFA